MEFPQHHRHRDLDQDGGVFREGILKIADKLHRCQIRLRGGADQDRDPPDVPRDGQVSQPQLGQHSPGLQTVLQGGSAPDQMHSPGEAKEYLVLTGNNLLIPGSDGPAPDPHSRGLQ